MSMNYDIAQDKWERFTFSRDGRVLTAAITSDHPVNGVDEQMHTELALVFNCLQRDTNSDIIILTAKGRAFCAGGDFDWFEEQINHPERFRAIGWDAKQIVATLLNMEKPILCRMNGAAAGLGALIWPQLVGFAKAKELLMTGDLLSAKEAERLGLINYAVPAAELDAKVAELVGKLQANPKWAVRWTKTTANIPLRALAAQLMDASVGWESVSNYLGDRREAVAAFKEKRAAKLTGD